MKSKLSPELLAELDRRTGELFARSFHCAQTSFSVLADQFGLETGPVIKALTPFPGVALRGETCGAISGCLMALGMVYGRESLDDKEGFLTAMPPARRFCRRFEAQAGSTHCREILQDSLGKYLDLSKRSDFKEYLASGGGEQCLQLVQAAVRIAAEIIVDGDEETEESGVMLAV